jgi:apolipoprotein D and lipocalin family protein
MTSKTPCRTGFFRRRPAIAMLLAVATLGLAGCGALSGQMQGNAAVPEPRKAVDLGRYAGIWHEQARYDAIFQRGCEGVTARYTKPPDGEIEVINTCRDGSVQGPERGVTGRARIVDGSGNAKLKVSFFGPFFFGDYWVLDRADDYSWAIVGEPSGRYLWLLTRAKTLPPSQYRTLVARAASLGYDVSRLRRTQQS